MARTDAQAGARAAGVWKKRLACLGAAVAVLAICVLARRAWGPQSASAQGPVRGPVRQAAAIAETAPQPAVAPAGREPRKLSVMATVNGAEIGRQQLADACIERFGKDVLESLVNKHLIEHHCRKRGIVVTKEEVAQEIQKTATKFQLGTDQWLGLLAKERGINPQQYARDIVWPTLALRKLAHDRIVPTPQDLKEAYQREFGPAVQARLIAVKDLQLARKLQAQLQVKSDDFARLAREHSVDVSSGSAGGLLQPIRRYMGDDAIEEAVFSLKEGEISPVVRIGEQFAIFKCEQHIPARNVPFEQVKSRLEDAVRERKLRAAAKDIFAEVQADAAVENVLNDPQKRRQMPGVAATINGQRITMLDLAEECLARHGEDVLEGEIHRLLLAQALKKRNLQVTQQELQAEIYHAVELAGVVQPDGKPDLKKWREMVTEGETLSWDLYVKEAVWPSAALKKLVGPEIKINEDDLRKGFEANYGPRVRCRAIVMNNLRRAQEVWGKARANPSLEFFGKLAQQYSVELGSRDLEGEVPPIRKHGGQPVLEREAFALQPGEMSGVIQVGENFVILYCEGYTEPIEVTMEEVRGLIHRDIYEKKLRVAMSEKFERLQAEATIDNFVAGTSTSPKEAAPKAATKPGSARPATTTSGRTTQ